MKPPNITPRKVLVVDDEPMVCDALRMMLQFDGHEVKTADSALSALTLFEREKFDLVVTDYSMWPTNGDELAAAIKARVPGQPVILITAYGEMLEASARPLPGVDCIITKPFQLADLRNAVARLASR